MSPLKCLLADLRVGNMFCTFLAFEDQCDSVLVNVLVSVHEFLRCCSSVESVNF